MPTSCFELQEGDEILGMLQLRHTPSKSSILPAGFESHIYYEINPQYRNKGNGTKILGLGLVEAKKIGLQEVIVTCTKDNIASQKIIETNKGELLDKQVNDEGVLVYKYRIRL